MREYIDFSEKKEVIGKVSQSLIPRGPDENGAYKFTIKKNAQDQNFEIDALSGATLTSVGVDNTAKYWFGNAYRPFLEKLAKGEIINE